jgi:hypothetical protein
MIQWPGSISPKSTAGSEIAARPGGLALLWSGLKDIAQAGPLVIASFLLSGAIVSLVVVSPNDFWLQLKVGSVIAEQQSVPETNMFAWGVPIDAPFYYAAWLGNLLFYLLYLLGGIELIVFSRNLIALLAFTLIGFDARRRVGSWRYVGLAIAVAGLLTVPIAVVRPQMWAWLPFTTCQVILARFIRGDLSPRWLLLLPFIMVFWVNVHGSFALGLLVIGIYWVGQVGSQLGRPLDRRNWRTLQQLTGVGVAMGLAALVNPLGIGIVPYVLKLVSLPANRLLVEEWLTPQLSDPYGMFFYGTSAFLGLVFALTYVRKRQLPGLTDMLLVIVFFLMAVRGYRYIFWFGLIAAPILAEQIKAVAPRLDVTMPRGRWQSIASAALFAFLCGLLVAVQPWTVQRVPLPEFLRVRTLPAPSPPLVSIGTPVAAAEYLRVNPGGKLMAEMGQASYLVWALPQQPAFLDTRVEMYPLEIWNDYLYISAGINFEERLEKYGIDRLLISTQFQSPLAAALRKSSAWEPEYSDPYAEIWRKRGSL